MPLAVKYLSAPGTIEIGGRHVKRYHFGVRPHVEDRIHRAAYDFLPRLLPPPCPLTPPASFVLVHREAGNATYLNGYSWGPGGLIECRSAVAGLPLLGSDDEDPEHFTELLLPWISCATEVAILAYERDAWRRHVLLPDHPDLAAYLADVVLGDWTELTA